LLHPRSRVQYVHKNTHTSIQVQRRTSDLPCAVVYGLCRAPRRRIRLVTVVGELAVSRKPGRARKTSANLTPATGARTTRFCRTRWHRSSGVTTIAHGKPALRSIFTHDAAASTASRPNVRDDGQRPSSRDRTARLIVLICPTCLAEYFCKAVWTGQITLIRLRKSSLWSNELRPVKCTVPP
jgi:hypothetical protein